MKYIKTYEYLKQENNDTIDIVNYPSGHIIEVTEDELKLLMEEDFDIVWDDEPDTDQPNYKGQWSYISKIEEDIEKFLKNFRNSGLSYEEYKNNKKYNL